MTDSTPQPSNDLDIGQILGTAARSQIPGEIVAVWDKLEAVEKNGWGELRSTVAGVGEALPIAIPQANEKEAGDFVTRGLEALKAGNLQDAIALILSGFGQQFIGNLSDTMGWAADTKMKNGALVQEIVEGWLSPTSTPSVGTTQQNPGHTK